MPKTLRATKQMLQFAWQAQPKAFAGIIVFQILQGSLPVTSAWITKQIFDLLGTTLQKNNDVDFSSKLFPLLIVQLTLSFLLELIGYNNRFLNSELTRKLTLKTQRMVYEKIIGLDGLAYFEDPHFHDMLSLSTQGATRGPMQMLYIFSSFPSSVITLVSFLGILLYLSPILTLVVILASLPRLYAQLKMGKQRFGIMVMNSSKERKMFYLGNVLSSITFAKEIRLFNLGKYFLDQFLQVTHEVQQKLRKQELSEIQWQIGLGALSNIVASFAFIVVISQAFSGQISIGDVTLYIAALASIQVALSSIISAFASLNENALYFSHFTDLLDLREKVPVWTPVQPIQSLKTKIEMRNVSFRYSEQHPWILRNVNLSFPKGKCLALVGLNGAGKTTLVKLLTRLYDPTEGQILWDGIDIRHFELAELRQHMSVIFQDFAHYDLTAQENIGLGNIAEIHNQDRIHRVAVEAGVDELLEKLPQGYQTVLSRWLAEDEVGVDLSGGQWQKVAIARMFMRDADFLILDEPTAALDAQAEYEVYGRFVELIHGHTCVLISHRFSTVRLADFIAVIENASVTEFGSHDELLKQGRTYARLYTTQANNYT